MQNFDAVDGNFCAVLLSQHDVMLVTHGGTFRNKIREPGFNPAGNSINSGPLRRDPGTRGYRIMIGKWLLSAGILLALAAPLVIAQGPGPSSRKRLYDPNTEVTMSGTIEEVQQHTGRRGKWTGTHLVLKTETGVLDVHVGPSSYISENQFSFAKGDSIQVVGSKVTVRGKEALLAREITKEGKTLTLRDAQGFPKWSGGRRGSN
jgi:hypothetical protein